MGPKTILFQIVDGNETYQEIFGHNVPICMTIDFNNIERTIISTYLDVID